MTEEEIAEVTGRMFLWFELFVKQGFSEDQALALTLALLTDRGPI